jgi:threonyl-tRNA synthetase
MDDLDHRSLGEALDLFHFSEDAPGSVFWHPRGHALYRAVEDHMRRRVRADGYREIRSPVLMSKALWERSGHWELYGANMFVLDPDGSRPMAVKPMNCPGHVEVFNHGIRSWRDLPVRLAEFGQCHRDEPSGALHGLLRLRGFVQDDGHVFCREDQVEAEVARFCNLLRQVYADFGFSSFGVGMSLRPEVRAGSDVQWDRAEDMLAAAAASCGLEPLPMPDEGAFYGPKLEFSLQDRRGRSWQCGTLQLDIILPERLGAFYRDANDGRIPPVMLHRAVLGSLERFVGILLEHHEGGLPAWLLAEQVAVIPFAERHACRAGEVSAAFERAGLRARLMDGPGWMKAKARDAALLRIPTIAVIGDREVEDGCVALRLDGTLLSLSLDDAVARMREWSAVPV